MTASTKKSNALLAAINRAIPVEESPPPEPAAVAVPRESVAKQKISSSAQRPSRVGTKLVAGHFDPKVARQLRLIAAEEDTTVQALLSEALDLLFVKKGKAHLSEIAKG